MEKKKKKKKKEDQQIASATSHEPDSNDLLGESDEERSKEEKNQPNNVAFAMKSTIGGSSSSHDNIPALNQQHPSNLQWPYPPQNNGEQPSSNSKHFMSSQSPPSIAVSQWHQLPNLQSNPASNQGHPLSQLAQNSTPFWLPQHPGYHLPRVNAPTMFQPFTPIGTINSNGLASGSVGGGTSSKDHPQVPNLCYQVGYAFPGFPGPWDPSSWWGQVHLSQPPTSYTIPGAYGYLPLQLPTVPGCSAPLGHSSQRGVIRPLAKLSQKHQQLWEAQSAENVQVWNVIDQLQSDRADLKNRIGTLEAEVSSLKQAMQAPTVHVTGTVVSGQASKRGRPRKTVASVDALHSPGASQPCPRGRKPIAQIFEKVILNKAENKIIPCNQPAFTGQEKEKVSNEAATNNGDMGFDRSNIILPSESSQMQMHGVSLGSSLNMKTSDNNSGDTNDAFGVLTQQAKGMHHALASCLAATSSGGNGWPYTITCGGSGRDVLNATFHSFEGNGSVIREGGKVIPGWSFVNEEDASEEREDAVAASGKDENEEEMGDDGSSGSEEIACSKGENLPQFGHW